MSKLVWEVKVDTGGLARNYTGRGNSPENALEDLRASLGKGIAASHEQVDAAARKLGELEGILIDMRRASEEQPESAKEVTTVIAR